MKNAITDPEGSNINHKEKQMPDQEIVDEINKMFPPQSIGYNVAFIVDGKPMVTSESFQAGQPEQVVNIYGFDTPDRKNNDAFGVHKELSKWLSKNGLWCEWEHGGGVHIYRQEKTDIS